MVFVPFLVYSVSAQTSFVQMETKTPSEAEQLASIQASKKDLQSLKQIDAQLTEWIQSNTFAIPKSEKGIPKDQDLGLVLQNSEEVVISDAIPERQIPRVKGLGLLLQNSEEVVIPAATLSYEEEPRFVRTPGSSSTRALFQSHVDCDYAINKPSNPKACEVCLEVDLQTRQSFNRCLEKVTPYVAKKLDAAGISSRDLSDIEMRVEQGKITVKTYEGIDVHMVNFESLRTHLMTLEVYTLLNRLYPSGHERYTKLPSEYKVRYDLEEEHWDWKSSKMKVLLAHLEVLDKNYHRKRDKKHMRKKRKELNKDDGYETDSNGYETDSKRRKGSSSLAQVNMEEAKPRKNSLQEIFAKVMKEQKNKQEKSSEVQTVEEIHPASQSKMPIMQDRNLFLHKHAESPKSLIEVSEDHKNNQARQLMDEFLKQAPDDKRKEKIIESLSKLTNIPGVTDFLIEQLLMILGYFNQDDEVAKDHTFGCNLQIWVGESKEDVMSGDFFKANVIENKAGLLQELLQELRGKAIAQQFIKEGRGVDPSQWLRSNHRNCWDLSACRNSFESSICDDAIDNPSKPKACKVCFEVDLQTRQKLNSCLEAVAEKLMDDYDDNLQNPDDDRKEKIIESLNELKDMPYDAAHIAEFLTPDVAEKLDAAGISWRDLSDSEMKVEQGKITIKTYGGVNVYMMNVESLRTHLRDLEVYSLLDRLYPRGNECYKKLPSKYKVRYVPQEENWEWESSKITDLLTHLEVLDENNLRTRDHQKQRDEKHETKMSETKTELKELPRPSLADIFAEVTEERKNNPIDFGGPENEGNRFNIKPGVTIRKREEKEDLKRTKEKRAGTGFASPRPSLQEIFARITEERKNNPVVSNKVSNQITDDSSHSDNAYSQSEELDNDMMQFQKTDTQSPFGSFGTMSSKKEPKEDDGYEADSNRYEPKSKRMKNSSFAQVDMEESTTTSIRTSR